MVIRPAILANRVASSKEITPHDLPKAQAPPLQPLQYSRGRVAPKIKSEKGRPKTLQAKGLQNASSNARVFLLICQSK